MESTLVIKVQYEDTLRRFNARVNENGILDLDMLGLKAKIFSLFDFPPGSDVTLAYIDEDGDVVTLVDDEDLCDVMRQQLKFLRIIVTIERSGRSYARSSGSATPLRSPSAQPPPIPNINAVVTEAMKSVPEALREATLKPYFDLLSKAASSSPLIADLIEQLRKLAVGQSGASAKATSSSPLIADLIEQLGKLAVGQSGAAASSASPSVAADGTKEASMPQEDVQPKAAATPGGSAPVTSDQHPFDLNVDPPVNPTESKKGIHFQQGQDPSASSSAGYTGGSCPFSGFALTDEKHLLPPFHSPKRGCKPPYAAGGVFHRGIRCDGCGVHPITGPRFKSLVKDDYDLCSICFAKMGREGDYIRMDKPVSYRHYRGVRPVPFPWAPPSLPHVFPHRAGFKRGGHGKPDSRFVSDVTIMDGTVMAPSTPFTKIWRMRNNGDFVWVSGTRLVWIGGDNFSQTDSVEIEVPTEGVPVDCELDIALDFVAPSAPGRYTSYWRLASPSGQKFGQRVWVLIQVDASVDSSANGNTSGALNLNLPPEAIGSIQQEMNNSQYAGGIDDFFMPTNSTTNTTTTVPVEPIAEEQQKGKDQDQNFPINDTLLVGNVGNVASAPPESSSSVMYPTIDPSDMGKVAAIVPPAPSSPPSSEAIGQSENNVGAGSEVHEENLLKELAEMGFKQMDLNKEVLRMNSYDLEQSVDDLCGVSEWDPILEDLQEMGFNDKEMNKRLLKKNDGSIRRVVMDLLTGEKA